MKKLLILVLLLTPLIRAQNSRFGALMGAAAIQGRQNQPPPSSDWFVSFNDTHSQRNNFTGNVGCKFTVGATNIVVTHLGRFCISGGTHTHVVKIVNMSCGDVGSVTVDATGINDAWNYMILASPVTLTAGTSYRLYSAELDTGDLWYDGADVNVDTSAATINSRSFDCDESPFDPETRIYGPVSFKFHL